MRQAGETRARVLSDFCCPEVSRLIEGLPVTSAYSQKTKLALCQLVKIILGFQCSSGCWDAISIQSILISKTNRGNKPCVPFFWALTHLKL